MPNTKNLHFEIIINATRQHVWDTMLDDATYREWTSVFNPGSYYKGSWEEGSKILFLGPDPKDGSEGGMVSRIKENRKHEFISIEHLGLYKDGVEDTTSEMAKKWAPALENYTFVEEGDGTKLFIDVETANEYEDMFNGMWPKALEKLKEICER